MAEPGVVARIREWLPEHAYVSDPGLFGLVTRTLSWSTPTGLWVVTFDPLSSRLSLSGPRCEIAFGPATEANLDRLRRVLEALDAIVRPGVSLIERLVG